jgi:hypothetical protein
MLLPIPLIHRSPLHSYSHAHTHPGVSPDEDDVTLLFEDVHRRRNVVPPHAVPVKPTLVRWDSARPLGVENAVVTNSGEAGI